MKALTFFKKNASLVAVIAMVLLACLIIFGTAIIAGGDNINPILPKTFLMQLLSSWDKRNLGHPNIDTANLFFYLFWWLAQKIGMSLIASQIIWFVFLELLALLWFYLLSRDLMNLFKIRVRKLDFTLILLFFLFNPIVFVSYSQSSFMLAYSMLPFLCFCSVRLFIKLDKRFIFILPLISIIYSYAGVNPPIYFASLFIPSVIFILSLIVNRKKIWQVLLYALPAGVLYLAVNHFWLSSLLNGTKGDDIQAKVDLSWPIWTSVNAHLLNVFQLLGSWSMNGYSFGSKNVIYSYLYLNKFYPFIILPLAALLILAWMRISRKKSTLTIRAISTLTLTLAIIFAILAVGPNKPFGAIFDFLYLHVPFFWLFREPWVKFSPSFFFLILLFAITIMSVLAKRSRLLIALRIFLIFNVALNLFVPLSGLLFSKDRGNFPGYHIILPDYFKELVEKEGAECGKESRILSYPSLPFYQGHFFWPEDGYYGADPLLNNSCRNLIDPQNGGGYVGNNEANSIIHELYDALNNQRWLEVENLLQKLAINEILFRNDLDYTQVGTSLSSSPEILQKIKSYFAKAKIEKFGTIKNSELKSDQYYQDVFTTKFENLDGKPNVELYQLESNPALFSAPAQLILGKGDIGLGTRILRENDLKKIDFVLSNENKSVADKISFTEVYQSIRTEKEINKIKNLEAYNESGGRIDGHAVGFSAEEYQAYLDNQKDLEYNFQLDQETVADLFIDIRNFSAPLADILEESQLTIDGKALKLNVESDQSRIKLFSGPLAAGSHRLIFTRPEAWDFYDLAPKNWKFSGDASFDGQSVYLRADLQKSAQADLPLEMLDPATTYLISAKVENDLKDNLTVRIIQDTDKKQSVLWQEQGINKTQSFDEIAPEFQIAASPEESGWAKQDYVSILRPNPLAKSFSLSFLLDDRDRENFIATQATKVKITDIHIIPLKTPVFFLSYPGDPTKNYLANIKNIKSVGRNKYELKISSESPVFPLTFAEGFNEGWQVSVKTQGDKLVQVDEKNHFKINGYANGWIIEPGLYNVSSDFTLVVEYRPEKQLLLSFLMLGGSSVIMLMGLIYLRFKKNVAKK